MATELDHRALDIGFGVAAEPADDRRQDPLTDGAHGGGQRLTAHDHGEHDDGGHEHDDSEYSGDHELAGVAPGGEQQHDGDDRQRQFHEHVPHA